LESKTDFELESMLHAAINMHSPLHECVRSRAYLIESEDDQYDIVNVPRYCTNPSATMPIVFEHKISIRWLDGVNCWVVDQQFNNQSGVYSSFSTYQLDTGGELINQSELRTVVICLIKVLSKKQNHEWR
ncbi:hypothetical protein, partial [Vibrio anguillarum]